MPTNPPQELQGDVNSALNVYFVYVFTRSFNLYGDYLPDPAETGGPLLPLGPFVPSK